MKLPAFVKLPRPIKNFQFRMYHFLGLFTLFSVFMAVTAILNGSILSTVIWVALAGYNGYCFKQRYQFHQRGTLKYMYQQQKQQAAEKKQQKAQAKQTSRQTTPVAQTTPDIVVEPTKEQKQEQVAAAKRTFSPTEQYDLNDIFGKRR